MYKCWAGVMEGGNWRGGFILLLPPKTESGSLSCRRRGEAERDRFSSREEEGREEGEMHKDGRWLVIGSRRAACMCLLLLRV